MRAVRTVASALLMILGASLIALWAVSGVVVRAVEDGSGVRSIAERALDDPAVVDAIGAAAANGALDALADAGINLERLGLDAVVRGAIDRAVRTPEFRAAMLDQVDSAYLQVTAAITADERPPGPLVIDVDPSGYVNSQIDRIPVVGEVAPDVAIAPIPVEVLDTDAVDDVRGAYALVELAERWGLWAGIAFIMLGLVVTRRTRWFMVKAGLAVGAIAGGLWLVLQWWGVDGIVSVLPGGAEGTAGAAFLRIVTGDTVALLESRLSVIAWVGFAVAAVFGVVAWFTRPRVR